MSAGTTELFQRGLKSRHLQRRATYMPRLYCLSVIILAIGVSNEMRVWEDSALLPRQWDTAGDCRALPSALSHLLSLESLCSMNEARAILKGAQGRCIPLLLLFQIWWLLLSSWIYRGFFSLLFAVPNNGKMCFGKIYTSQHLLVIHTAFMRAASGALCLVPTPQKTMSHTYLFLLALIPLIFLFCGFFSPVLTALFLCCTKNCDF